MSVFASLQAVRIIFRMTIKTTMDSTHPPLPSYGHNELVQYLFIRKDYTLPPVPVRQPNYLGIGQPNSLTTLESERGFRDLLKTLCENYDLNVCKLVKAFITIKFELAIK